MLLVLSDSGIRQRITVAALGIAGLFAVAKGLGLAAPGSVYAYPDLPLAVAAVAFSALMSGLE